MKIINCEQGSVEWFDARAFIPTASNFDRIITPTGKESTQVDAYANEILAAKIAGKAVTTFEGNMWTERGNELEPEAAAFYEFTKNIQTEVVGFCTNDAGTYGASPDRLVGEDGLLEIKCPAPHTHVSYMLNGKAEQKYIPQIQGQLLITGRKWCDFISYHPEMPSIIIRIERDDSYINELIKFLDKFDELLNKKELTLKEKGYL